ncbi:hypothetical protein Tco_1437470 [Tanacetum coccineum]
MRRKRVNKEAEANAPPKALRKDHAFGPAHSTREGKSLAAMGLDAGSTFSPRPAARTNTNSAVSDPEPQSSSKGAAAEIPMEDVATTEVNVQLSMGSLNLGKSTSPSVGGLPGAAPPAQYGIFEPYNMNLARQVAMGSQLRLRKRKIKETYEEIISLKTVETEVHGLRNRTQNLETLLEDEVDMKKATEAKSVDLTGELESLCEERIKAAFEEFKKSEDEKVEHRVQMDAKVFADVVSAGIIKGMSDGFKYGVEHGEAKLDLAAIEAYDPEAEAKYIAALTALRDLKYPLVDQLKKLRDAPIDLLIASLHLESDSGEDAPEWIRELRPSTSQSRAKKKKKYRVVCRTHRVGSVHHARSDGILVSAPTVAPQGLAILLADAAVQTEASEDEASPRLLRSKSLPPMYNLYWP